ncbi:MAG: mono/diheme cytochrome c family protein/glucose/arabinose dehydrogenase [Arcticibacterium sp.]|jgi:mono/diheme cytochrome c family protein/glucose/arabinose dehydrogenase
MKSSLWLLALLSFGMISSDDPSPPRSAEEELKTFQIAEGFKIELAAAEPLIQDPVFIKFDERGRLWVIEMRGYMQTIDGANEDAPIGKVAFLEDKNGDGQLDTRTTYADSLVMPRALAFYLDGVLIAEAGPLWFYEDLNGDGKSDKRTLVDSTYGANGLPEHAPNGLLLGMDNWLYNAKSDTRYKRQGEVWKKEKTEFRGQWGIAKDDYGRLYYNYNWSQLHADLVPPNYLNRNPNYESTTGIDHGLSQDRRVFPIRPNPAVNRGYIPGTLNEKGSLIEFTSACSPFIARDNLFYPADFKGNALVCEPAGNLIKRNLIKEDGIYMNATNAYESFEFLASTDERFRPVSITSGPDGAIYVADMYRGINQHAAYMTEYLTKQTLERGLDKHIHLGRIWKITPEDFEDFPLENPDVFWQLNTDGLGDFLMHPIAWFRDQSFRVILERRPMNIEDVLANVLKSKSVTGKMAAISILNELNTLRPEVALSFLSDPSDKVKALTLRLLGKQALTTPDLTKKIEDALVNKLNAQNDVFTLQILLSSNAYSQGFAFHAIQKILIRNGDDPLMREATLSALDNREAALLSYLLQDPTWKSASDGKKIFLEQLAIIILKRRDEKEISHFLETLSKTDDWQKSALIEGAALQIKTSSLAPIRLKTKPTYLDNKAFETLEKGLTWPGKKKVKTETNTASKLDAKGMKQFVAGRQGYLSYCAGCHGADGNGMKRFAPPLEGSDWVTGSPDRLALLLSYGIEGPIEVKGRIYDVPDILPVMPSHGTLALDDMANIITYIRNAWGHSAEATSARTVGMLRIKTQGKVTPWTTAELNSKMEEL